MEKILVTSVILLFNSLLWNEVSLQIPNRWEKGTHRGGPAGGIYTLRSIDCIKEPKDRDF